MDVKKLNPFSRSYFLSEDILALSQDLLGHYIVTSFEKNTCIAKIVELEAYKAPLDKGSHAYQNKRTKRTEVIFGEGGHAYVYLCYGIHEMFNLVSGPIDVAHAILIRAVEPISGKGVMQKRRNKEAGPILTNGPGTVSYTHLTLPTTPYV